MGVACPHPAPFSLPSCCRRTRSRSGKRSWLVMGKTFSRDTDYVRDNWSTRSTECCLCAWLIRDCNNDLMKACDVGDVKMISTCVTCGAWMNYTMPRDPAGNTPLHLAVQQCDEFK